MFIRITEITETTFGKTIGQDTITVTQEAACSAQSVRIGTGMLPIGALAGPWSGDLFDCAAKVTGNCGALAPDGTGANAYRDAVANGITGNFIKHHGNRNSAYPQPDGPATIDCYAEPCSVLRTEPGNMVGPWNQGLTTRFSNIVGADCVEALWFNCDKVTDVFATDANLVGLEDLGMMPGGEPGWWEDSLYGTFLDAKAALDAKHWYYNGQELKCDSVRLATVPIVNKDLDWKIGDGASTWPNGRKDMKIIGFYTIYIRQPIAIADLGGPIDADIIWFGPDAKCDSGEAFQPLGDTVVVDAGVKLVAP